MLSKFVFTFLIPALLFIGTAKAKIPDDMQWKFLFSYYVAVFFVYLIGAVIAKVFFNCSNQEQSIFGMGAAYSNATIVGIPICIYVLGASLNKYKMQGNITPALTIVALKMLMLPTLVWLLVFQLFTIDPLWASTALLTSAMPIGISVYVFSQKYQQYEAPVATGIVASTLFSVVSLAVISVYVRSVI